MQCNAMSLVSYCEFRFADTLLQYLWTNDDDDDDDDEEEEEFWSHSQC